MEATGSATQVSALAAANEALKASENKAREQNQQRAREAEAKVVSKPTATLGNNVNELA